MTDLDLKSLSAELRLLADRLDSLSNDDESVGLKLRVELRAYSVNSIEHLRSIYSVMSDVTSDRSRGYQWIKGMIGPFETTVHYAAGLLGKKKKTTIKVVDSEYETDLSVLRCKQ